MGILSLEVVGFQCTKENITAYRPKAIHKGRSHGELEIMDCECTLYTKIVNDNKPGKHLLMNNLCTCVYVVCEKYMKTLRVVSLLARDSA